MTLGRLLPKLMMAVPSTAAKYSNARNHRRTPAGNGPGVRFFRLEDVIHGDRAGQKHWA